MQPVKKRKLAYKFCPHCGNELNIRSYKDHKRLYFDEETNSWFQESKSVIPGYSSDELSPPPSPIQQPMLIESSPEPVPDITEESMEDLILPSDDYRHESDVHNSQYYILAFMHYVQNKCTHFHSMQKESSGLRMSVS